MSPALVSGFLTTSITWEDLWTRMVAKNMEGKENIHEILGRSAACGCVRAKEEEYWQLELSF